MKLTVLGSGSTGNAVLIVAGDTRVLVDAGLSAKEIARRLALMGEDIHRLDGVLVTHEHGDHVGGLRVLLRSVDCPVYISATTCDAYISERTNIANDEFRKRAAALNNRVEQIESSKDFRIGEIDFHPFTIPHDAADNFGFTATHQGVKIATLMDFGHITTLINEQLRGCAAIMIESNHSRDMLKACDNYPWELKQRILSRLGHISNEDIAEWLRDGFDGTARHIVLAHLSQRANNPYLAKISAEVALQERAPLFPAETQISLSFPKEPTPWIEV
jgi:phosphoribosyl 1,2-cyclic phosphodiesterase